MRYSHFYTLSLLILAALTGPAAWTQDLIQVSSSNPVAGGVVGGGPVAPGDAVTVSAIALQSGFYFTSWTENGTIVSTNPIYHFTIPQPPLRAGRTLIANFDSNHNPHISIFVVGNGTITGGGDTTPPMGTIVTATASANNGSWFVGWSENGDLVSTAPSYSFSVGGTRTLLANFAENAPAPLGIGGSVLKNHGGFYADRFIAAGNIFSDLTMTAKPSGGVPPYHYRWTMINASVAQSESPTMSHIMYGENAVDSDVITNDELPVINDITVHRDNPIHLTITDHIGATLDHEWDRKVMIAQSVGPVSPLPGWRMYAYSTPISNQRFDVYIPQSYDPSRPMPVMFNVNKRGNQGITDFRTYANSMGFILVGLPDMGQDSLDPDRNATMMNIIDRLASGPGYHGLLNIDRANVLCEGGSGGVPYGVWDPAGQHPEFFMQLSSESGNWWGNTVDTAFKTRPIYISWGEQDRPSILSIIAAELQYFRSTLGCTDLTSVMIPNSGHQGYPERIVAWWSHYLPHHAPIIVTQPTNTTAVAGERAGFTVVAPCSPVPMVVWQVSTDGGLTWANAPYAYDASHLSTTLVLWPVALNDSGKQFRCVISNDLGTVITSSVQLTVVAHPVGPVIVGEPSNESLLAGGTARMSVIATGIPDPAFAWQTSMDGVVWASATGTVTTDEALGRITSHLASTPLAFSDNGRRYRCVVSNRVAAVTSQSAIISISDGTLPPTITNQPHDQSVIIGASATFTLVAAGSPLLTYAWQTSSDGNIWTTVTTGSGSTSSTYTTHATLLSDNGIHLRCVVTNGNGISTSNTAVLTVTNPSGGTTIAIIDPLPNATLSGDAGIQVTASAADSSGTIEKVEFFANDVQVGETSTQPYTYMWSSMRPGSYILTCRAIENGGMATTSAMVPIVVTSSRLTVEPSSSQKCGSGSGFAVLSMLAIIFGLGHMRGRRSR